MTVTALVTRNDITATASQTSFTYTFRVLAATDMDVYQNGVLLSSGYTVNNVGNTTGGTVTLDSGVPVGQIVSLVLAMPLDRTTNYQNSGKFLADDVNEDFDKIYIGAVQNENEGGRSLRLKDVEPPTSGVDMTIPLKDDRKGKLLSFNSITGAPEASTASVLYDSAAYTPYNFTGDGSTVAFTLGSTPNSENNTQVYIDGIYQQKDGYNVSGAVLTFSVAPPNLSTIEVMVTSALAVGSTSSDLVSYTPAGTGAVATTVQAKLRESVSVKDFGAVGDGVTDDTAAIQAAIDYATANNISKVLMQGKFSLGSQVVIKAGVSLDGGGYKRGPRYWGGGLFTGWKYESQATVVYVNFGSGTGSSTDYTKSAFVMQDGTEITGLAFNYPSQSMTVSTPVEYGPAIAIDLKAGSSTTDQATEDCKISDINLGNCYVGIDARRDHSQITIQNINGYPLKYGIRIGSSVDNDTITHVHFARLNVLRGNLPPTLGMIQYVNNNAIGLDVGRSSWGVFENIFCFGYKRVVNAYYQDANPSLGMNKEGGMESARLINIGGDSCERTIHIENIDQDGNVVTGETHWGIIIENMFSTPVSESATSQNLTDPMAFYWKTDNPTGGNRWFKLDGLHMWNGEGQVMYVEGARGASITSSKLYSYNSDEVITNYGIELKKCEHIAISNSFMDAQNRANTHAIYFGQGNSYINIHDNNFVDFSQSNPIKITNDSNSRYKIYSNHNSGSTSIPLVSDLQNDTYAYLAGNIDEGAGYILGDGNVDSNGLLTLPYQTLNGIIRYQGTESIKGMTSGKRGMIVTIRFTNTCTVFDDSGSVSGSQVLRMNGNFSATNRDAITFVWDNDAWYEISRSSN